MCLSIENPLLPFLPPDQLIAQIKTATDGVAVFTIVIAYYFLVVLVELSGVLAEDWFVLFEVLEDEQFWPFGLSL